MYQKKNNVNRVLYYLQFVSDKYEISESMDKRPMLYFFKAAVRARCHSVVECLLNKAVGLITPCTVKNK